MRECGVRALSSSLFVAAQATEGIFAASHREREKKIIVPLHTNLEQHSLGERNHNGGDLHSEVFNSTGLRGGMGKRKRKERAHDRNLDFEEGAPLNFLRSSSSARLCEWSAAIFSVSLLSFSLNVFNVLILDYKKKIQKQLSAAHPPLPSP